MLLAIDAGNSSVKVAIYNGAKLEHQVRIRMNDQLTPEQYYDFLQDSFEIHFGKKIKINKAVICSVVPKEASKLSEMIKNNYQIEPIIVGPKVNTGINICVTEPYQLGTDRLTNAAAAKSFYQLPALVFDIGTAMTADYTDAEGNFMGGLIIPGPEVAYKSMNVSTAQLPLLHISAPINMIGKNTAQAMHSGIYYGWLSMIEGITAKIRANNPELKTVIISGGYAELLSKDLPSEFIIDKQLTIKGLKVIADLN